MRCAVYGCGADNQAKAFSREAKFFSFPKDKKVEGIWRHLCKRNDKFNVRSARICSKHFSDDDYKRNLKHELLPYKPKKYRLPKKEAIPSKNLPLLGKKFSLFALSKFCEKTRILKIIEIILYVLSLNYVNLPKIVDDDVRVLKNQNGGKLQK
ncbi:hypothetical protein RI129_004877 [Pyrocoelia pectoralis]|uniref:THAP-type domain-containing protein n=1 Tax=Pyrocoelia pectoralis TaxID=417401 RepID=A0AAN7VJP7_9COLE